MKITVGGVLWWAVRLAFASVVMSAAQGNNTFCVTSCAGYTQCPNTTLNECHDLSWYAAHRWSSSEVTLMFTSGDHVLSLGDFWWIQNLTSISFVGYGDLTKHVSSGSYNTSLSRILCSNSSRIAFSNITQISITNLIISGCGAQLYQADSTNTAVYFKNITNLTIINTSIENSGGIGISAIEVLNLQILHSIFIQNQGAILANFSTLYMQNSTIANNYGFGLYAKSSTTYVQGSNFISNYESITIDGCQQVLFDGCTVMGTMQKRGLVLITSSINITDSTFTNNALGAITASSSTIAFNGMVLFKNNTSIDTGGAIQLLTGSTMILNAPSNLTFVQNSAPAYGGAIYTASCDQALLTSSPCFFDIIDINGTLANPGVHMTFLNNTVNISGSVIYGNNLDICTLNMQNIYEGANAGDVFEAICDYKEHNNSLPEVSSDAFNVCICYNDIPVCTIADAYFAVYPGQSIEVSVITAGQRNGSSPTPIIAYHCLPTPSGGCSQYSLLGAQLPRKECSLLNYTTTQNLVNDSILLVSSFSSISRSNFFNDADHLFMHIQVLECPLGFSLQKNGSYGCVCNTLLMKHNVSCDIKSQTISRQNSVWVGLHDGMPAVHDHCPLGFCKQDLIQINLNSTNSTDVQCASNRTGLVCGTCTEGLSVTFGSGQCQKCSNFNLSLLLLFLVAGLILVLLLFIFNLTITTGSINGLIYFANVVSINSANIFPSYGYNGYIDFLSVFISWINLDFGIPVCFYDGMDTYAHTWLQFVFPIYISVLALCIIIGGKFSLRISRYFRHNTVPVLATLVLLSFAKLLRTVITVFSATSIYVGSNDNTVVVWTYDGTIKYLQPKHAILFVFSLVITIGFLAPYTLLLLFAPLLQKYSQWRVLKWVNRLKPFIDAHYGPYEDHFRMWTGVLLLARIAFYFAFAVNLLNETDLISLMIIILQSLLFVPGLFAGGIYKNRVLNALEYFYLINLNMLAGAYLYTFPSDENKAIISGLFVGGTLLCFLVILTVHIWLTIKRLMIVKNVNAVHPIILGVNRAAKIEMSLDRNAKIEMPLDLNGSWSQITELRETLLEN